MTFDSLQLLTIAESMDISAAAGARTAINRAYYAIFLKTRDNLLSAGRMTGRGAGQEHGEVIYTLRRNHRHRAAQRLAGLRILRQQADYRTDLQTSMQDAREALEAADDIRRLLGPDWGTA